MAIQEKYISVIEIIKNCGGRDISVSEDGGVLNIIATVPYPKDKNDVWNKIKEIGGDNPSDIRADIRLDNAEDLKIEGAGNRTYVVKSGDNLSKISKEMYGDANKYMEIFNANKDKLSNPDKINPGMELIIP